MENMDFYVSGDNTELRYAQRAADRAMCSEVVQETSQDLGSQGNPAPAGRNNDRQQNPTMQQLGSRVMIKVPVSTSYSLAFY